MKKTLFSLFTAVSLALLYCPAAFALTEDEAVAAVDAQETSALLICLRTELCNLQELIAARKSAVLLAVCYDVLCDHFADAGNVG